jgi:predicted cation transporter
VPDPVIVNLIILLIVLIGPLVFHRIEENLEAFLFVMGVASALASRVLSADLILESLSHPVPITVAVLVFGAVFARTRQRLFATMGALVARAGPVLPAVVAIIMLGLASSVITAIIASLVFVEFVAAMRLSRADEIRLTVLACFAIGLGAALTPIGEPLSTIAVAKLKQEFWFLFRLLGAYVIPAVVAIGAMARFFIAETGPSGERRVEAPPETARGVVARAARIYLFVLALIFLAEGFRPLIERYILGLDPRALYWANTVSAVLDNATLTAAEIDPRMSDQQVRAILMGLLISGGMLIPGNVPNIIAAGRLRISSREWARAAVPIGVVLLIVFYIGLFVL